MIEVYDLEICDDSIKSAEQPSVHTLRLLNLSQRPHLINETVFKHMETTKVAVIIRLHVFTRMKVPFFCKASGYRTARGEKEKSHVRQETEKRER